jgi:hypothetical protein
MWLQAIEFIKWLWSLSETSNYELARFYRPDRASGMRESPLQRARVDWVDIKAGRSQKQNSIAILSLTW